MSVAVVVPLQGNCPHRRAAWEWVRGRYFTQHPNWRVCLVEGVRPHAGVDFSGSNAPAAARFCKAALINPAIEASDAEIVVVADADVWCDGLSGAVEAVKAGAPWAIPHDQVFRLSEEGTAAVLAGEDWRGQLLTQPAYQGMQGGGVVVASRETLLDIPMDSRFQGWGQEDQAWAMALYHLAGPAWRGAPPLVHLWHPEPQRLSRKHGSVESWNLFRRYTHARRNPAEMRALVEESKA